MIAGEMKAEARTMNTQAKRRDLSLPSHHEAKVSEPVSHGSTRVD